MMCCKQSCTGWHILWQQKTMNYSSFPTISTQSYIHVFAWLFQRLLLSLEWNTIKEEWANWRQLQPDGTNIYRPFLSSDATLSPQWCEPELFKSSHKTALDSSSKWNLYTILKRFLNFCWILIRDKINHQDKNREKKAF